MLIGIPKEKIFNETRVAATPNTVKELIKLGFNVVVEYDAGKLANFNNELYTKSGAILVDTSKIWESDIIIKVNPPNDEEINFLHKGIILISFFYPADNQLLMNQLSNYKMTVISMDSVPRISKAQTLDALSSMSNIAGYRAVIEAAHEFGRFFKGQITAAGKIPPAKVMVIGAGVAGLSAIGTASSLGAIVYAFDTRAEVKEQVESIGARFLELNLKNNLAQETKDEVNQLKPKNIFIAEKELFQNQSKDVDIIITTAIIPGKSAPKIITKDMIYKMRSGSVIVDLAAQNGGNTELTIANKIIKTDNDIKIIGYTNFPSLLPNQSSQLYSNNILNLLKLLCKEKNGKIILDFTDEIIRHITVIHNGEITWPAPIIKIPSINKISKNIPNIKTQKKSSKKPIYKSWLNFTFLTLICILFISFGHIVPSSFLSHFFVLCLSCIIGYYVVWNVNHSLHTPLMSVTNAISGIIMLGSILQIGHGNYLVNVLAFISILITSINVFGAFNITYRMLKMFRKNKKI